MDKASQKRAEILDAAYSLFSQKGYHATRIEDIAAEIGMSQGLFYRYFRNKLDIFAQIMDEMILRISEGIAGDAPANANNLEEYIEQMERAVERLFTILVDDRLISKLLSYETIGINEDINRKIEAVWDLFGEFSSLYVKNGVAKGILRSDLSVKETGLAFNALVLEAVRQIVRSDDRDEAKKVWKRNIVNLMIKGTADQDALNELLSGKASGDKTPGPNGPPA
jgi:AcrR family transcriptional regulator